MVEHLKDISEHGVHLPANMIGLLPDQISELKLCEPDVQLTEPSQGTQVMPLAEYENKPLITMEISSKERIMSSSNNFCQIQRYLTNFQVFDKFGGI